MKFLVVQLICVSIYLAPLTVRGCDRRPMGFLGDRTPANENFQIYIEGNPHAYIPGKKYHSTYGLRANLLNLTQLNPRVLQNRRNHFVSGNDKNLAVFFFLFK